MKSVGEAKALFQVGRILIPEFIINMSIMVILLKNPINNNNK